MSFENYNDNFSLPGALLIHIECYKSSKNICAMPRYLVTRHSVLKPSNNRSLSGYIVNGT